MSDRTCLNSLFVKGETPSCLAVSTFSRYSFFANVIVIDLGILISSCLFDLCLDSYQEILLAMDLDKLIHFLCFDYLENSHFMDLQNHMSIFHTLRV